MSSAKSIAKSIKSSTLKKAGESSKVINLQKTKMGGINSSLFS